MEFSTRSRGNNPFPKHWRGFAPGQDAEERAALIVVNLALDLEARGDRPGAEELRQNFIRGHNPHARDSNAVLQARWVNNPTAANALAWANRLANS